MTKAKTIQSKPLAYSLNYLALMFFFLELMILLLFLQGFSESEPGAELVVVLFAIPPVFQLLGLLVLKDVLLKRLYFVLSFLSSGFYFASLLYYMFETKPRAYSGWVCIVASAMLVVIAFSLTSATFRDTKTTVGNSIVRRLAASIGTSPSGEMLVYLAFFVSIGYLLGFALAFHDRTRSTQGLLPGLIAEAIPGREGDASGMRRERPDEDGDKRWEIFFKSGSAKVEFDPRERRDVREDREGLEYSLATQNQSTLSQIVSRLLESKGLPVRVTLIAHSDETRLGAGSQYLSNYELAQARANSVHATVLELLSKRENVVWKNIEWLVVPLPEPTSGSGYENLRRQRAVEVLVRLLPQEGVVTGSGQIRLLTLLEHIYFSMYTITTTGYGDIKPSTPYAMFVCTLENLYEVFFMVVFFNVLLSPKARARRQENGAASPVENPATGGGPLVGNADTERASGPAVLEQPESGDSDFHPRIDVSPSKKRENRKKRRR